MRNNRFSTPSDKSDGSLFTTPEGFRVLEDVPASLIELRGGLTRQTDLDRRSRAGTSVDGVLVQQPPKLQTGILPGNR